MDNVVGIKEAAINNIVMDIECYENNIKQILNQIASTYEKMSKCTNYSGTQTYISKSRIISENTRTIISNLENYKYDLVSVKKKYKSTVNNIARDISAQARKIDVGTEYRRIK